LLEEVAVRDERDGGDAFLPWARTGRTNVEVEVEEGHGDDGRIQADAKAAAVVVSPASSTSKDTAKVV
jgi:hypothetical protein